MIDSKLSDLNYPEFKSLVLNNMMQVQYLVIRDEYLIKAFDGPFQIGCIVKITSPANDEQSDFETNLKPKANKQLIPRDMSGREIVRNAITSSGWHYQLFSIELTTSKYQGFYCKKEDETDVGFITHKLYDASNNEITSSSLETTATKTVVWMRPTHDYEPLGAIISQYASPATDIYFWAIGVPGIANVNFLQGGMNLKQLGIASQRIADGRVTKFMQYIPQVPDANSFKFVMRHTTGTQHTFQILMELYRAV